MKQADKNVDPALQNALSSVGKNRVCDVSAISQYVSNSPAKVLLNRRSGTLSYLKARTVPTALRFEKVFFFFPPLSHPFYQ